MNLKGIMLSLRSQVQTVTYNMIPYIQHSQKRQNYSEEQISDCQGLGVGEGKTIKGQDKEVFWG